MRETLADIEREMAKPRLAESVRKADELAEEKRSRMRLLPGAKGRGPGLTPKRIQCSAGLV